MSQPRRTEKDDISTSMRTAAMKRSRTWKDPQQKKSKIGLSSYFEHLFLLNNLVKVPSIAASSYCRFTTFKNWLESSRFYLKDEMTIIGSVKVVDDITMHIPLNQTPR
ncbi:PREDICTED: uncharacterized protein LOC109580845 [Amphimedon queenslandica]|uniref:Uncharacterized protein n=1 Tax=Amphimedon queenslandica TaxID=400682 RepID=A0AAN0IYW0_AMPQE|nr:PREDICTED: uncharacterized protein LOC109580845 [Amphimedon queenslandica]|eukprot:XP_019849960.1 PREDICTED: uncharacterized protein LOC109580845 [Amphimedon queenslandica]